MSITEIVGMAIVGGVVALAILIWIEDDKKGTR